MIVLRPKKCFWKKFIFLRKIDHTTTLSMSHYIEGGRKVGEKLEFNLFVHTLWHIDTHISTSHVGKLMDFQCFGFGDIAIPDTQIAFWVSHITFLAAPPNVILFPFSRMTYFLNGPYASYKYVWCSYFSKRNNLVRQSYITFLTRRS